MRLLVGLRRGSSARAISAIARTSARSSSVPLRDARRGLMTSSSIALSTERKETSARIAASRLLRNAADPPSAALRLSFCDLISAGIMSPLQGADYQRSALPRRRLHCFELAGLGIDGGEGPGLELLF